MKACESAYEAGELLKEQLSLLMREKDIAEAQVSIWGQSARRTGLESNLPMDLSFTKRGLLYCQNFKVKMYFNISMGLKQVSFIKRCLL